MSKQKLPMPARSRRKEVSKAEKRETYYKALAGQPVSGTTSGLSSEATQEETTFTGGTGYIPQEEEAPAKPLYEDIKSKPVKYEIKEHVGLISSIIGILIFLGMIVTAYNSLTNKVDNIKTDLSDYKKDNSENIKQMDKTVKDDLRYINDRIDKYISKKP